LHPVIAQTKLLPARNDLQFRAAARQNRPETFEVVRLSKKNGWIKKKRIIRHTKIKKKKKE
jgi:hypothetical protein